MNNDVQRVRDSIDLVALISEYVPLEPKGREWVGVCPFHDDHKPSMCVVTHHENAFYKCFSCGASGSCFDFVKNYLKMEFKESLIFLADRAGIELSYSPSESDEGKSLRTKMKDAMEWAASEFKTALTSTPEGNLATDLLNARGFTTKSIEQFSLGVAPDDWGFLADRVRENDDRVEICLESGLLNKKDTTNRVYDAFRNRLMFPICNEFGATIAFGGRRLHEEDEPKYINSPETELFHKSKTLYGYYQATKTIRDKKQAVVVEGYTDVIACHQAGMTNVVGTLGTAFTKEHTAMLARICETAVLVFDGDDAGQRAADRAIEIFFNSSLDVLICVLPDGKDPADLAFETDTLQNLIENAVDALAFKLNRLEASLSDQSTTSGKERLVESFIHELSRLGFEKLSGIRKRFVYERIGILLSMSMKDVESLMQSHQQQTVSRNNRIESDVQQVTSNDVSRRRQRAEYELLAVLLFDPQESSAVIRESKRPIEVNQFIDSAAQDIASNLLPQLKSGITCSMQEVLENVNELNKPIASTLYFDGQRLSESYGSVMLAVTSSVTAFFETLDYKAMNDEIKNVKSMSDPLEKARAAQVALEAMRQQKLARNA